MRSQRSLVTRGTAWLTTVAFVSRCRAAASRTPPPRSGRRRRASDVALQQTGDAPPGLDIRLSDGKQRAAAFDRSDIAPATKLSDADATSCSRA